MPLIGKLVVCGVGLIGGSFALALPNAGDGQPDGGVAGSQALLELTDYAPLPLRGARDQEVFGAHLRPAA